MKGLRGKKMHKKGKIKSTGLRDGVAYIKSWLSMSTHLIIATNMLSYRDYCYYGSFFIYTALLFAHQVTYLQISCQLPLILVSVCCTTTSKCFHNKVFIPQVLWLMCNVLCCYCSTVANILSVMIGHCGECLILSQDCFYYLITLSLRDNWCKPTAPYCLLPPPITWLVWSCDIWICPSECWRGLWEIPKSFIKKMWKSLRNKVIK